MKKTMLTCETLDRFEKLVDISALTEEQIKEVEYCAYCANMGAESKETAWNWFCHLIKNHLGIDIK